MRHNITLAVLVAGGLAFLAGQTGTVHAENLSDKLQKLKDTANSLTAVTQATAFDGVWFSNQWRYGFKIQGKTGIATQSNSPKFKPGDVILRIDSVSGQTFRGTQIYTDGVWRPVTGQLANGTLRISGPTSSWVMTRTSTGSADQGKVAAAQKTTQNSAATGQAAVSGQNNAPKETPPQGSAANSGGTASPSGSADQGRTQSAQAASPAGQGATPNQQGSPQESSSQGGATKVKGTGGAGPDVIGLRLRMTPAEIAAVIKARANLKEFREYSSVLQYRSPNGTYADLPGGDFHRHSHAYQVGDRFRGNDEEVLVFFAPVPGKDLAVGVSRYQQFPDGKEPDYDTVIKSLLAKYGKPSARSRPGTLESLVWLYDGNLKPKSKSVDLNSLACQGVPAASKNAPGAGSSSGSGSDDVNWALTAYNVQENAIKCSETILSVSVTRRMVSPQQPSPLVIGIDTRLSGLGDILSAQKEGKQVIAAQENKALGKEAAKAKQRKPDL